MSGVRVRIAPSPSGFLHIGTAKIALFNWLFARREGGAFILRLEDTDAERSDEQFVMAMCEGFHWLGIDWDEGPEFGDVPQKGERGPYRQSRRIDIHREHVQRLLDAGRAYKCFATKEELEEMREAQKAAGKPPRYDGRWRDASPEQVAEAEAAGKSYVVRFRVPEGTTTLHDLVQGDVLQKNSEFDDFVIQKPDGSPIFHLAVVVDDATMGITHVIRGDDHMTNAIRHIMLFEALEYPVPHFAHLPMVLDERGKKYSKREHGANVLDWRQDGFLPDALINYVALLGWTPAEEGRELFTREELIPLFTPDRFGKSSARFDRKKLEWLNGQHIRMLAPEKLRDMLLPILHAAGFDTSGKTEAWLTQMAAICQEKIPTLNAIVEYTDFFFREISEYEEKGVRKHFKRAGAKEHLEAIAGMLRETEPWNAAALKARFETRAESEGTSLGQYVHPARLALTGKTIGPGLFELAELLGRDTCIERVEGARRFAAALPQETN